MDNTMIRYERLESCPVEKSKNYRDCPITRDCIRPKLHGKVKGIRCPIDWWVCPACLPNICPKMKPENPEGIVGEIIWLPAH